MQNVFLSHSTADAYFVNLLEEMLRYHGIDTWCCRSDLVSGSKMYDSIIGPLGKSSSLVVVVSKNSTKSKWVAEEVAVFRTTKTGAKIIPIKLDSTDPDNVAIGLKDYTYIDFSECMLQGFKKLLSTFDKEFLYSPILAVKEERRRTERRTRDRRLRNRRRSDTVLLRMRREIWFSYYKLTGDDEFAELPPLLSKYAKVIEGTAQALDKFDITDKKGDQIAADVVAAKSVGYIRSQLETGALPRSYNRSIYVTELIAEYICKSFHVGIRERRTAQRRQKVNRREDIARN